jgi:hypothetical protein
MNKTVIIFFLFICSAAYAQTGELKGKVMQKNTENVIDDVSISIYYGDSLFASIIPDFKGEYIVRNLPAGKVTVICKKDSFATLIEKNIPVSDGKTTIENFALRKTTRSNDIDLIEYKGTDAEKPIVSKTAPAAVTPVVVQPTTIAPEYDRITLLADSEVNKASQREGWYFKVGNREPMHLKFFAGNLSYYLERNPQASAELSKYVKMKATKFGLQLGFAGLMGIYAGSFFFDKKNDEIFGGYRAVLLSGGVVCVGISAFLEEKKDKHLKKAVEIYDAGK